MMRGWDFPYAALTVPLDEDHVGPCDVIVATPRATPPSAIAEALAGLLGERAERSGEVTIETLIARAPLFWTRVVSPVHVSHDRIAAALASRGIAVRYVASASRASMRLGPALRFAGVDAARAQDWLARRRAIDESDPPSPGRWFLRAHGGGIAVDRARGGIGAGTRLAVIDDDAAEAEHLHLDALVLVGVARAPEATSHGALMVAWAVGSRGERGFQGVAPASSPRLYCIPKPGIDVVSLPLAIARAVFDGADVVVCATYIEGSNCPMMDDALSVAQRLGRRGRGTAVVFPTGREASSPPGSLHSSWSLALGDPPSDSRAFCIGPSAREGSWFLWRDRRGRLRPFANRGPAVRWLAPGDDIAYPFGDRDRLFHAESSGASAIAAGMLLLLLGTNPSLRLSELDAIVTRTIEPLPAAHDACRTPLADAFDVLPAEVDHDGHNAKHGYGRIHARRACLAASDPVALALLAIGDEPAALALPTTRAWSRRLGRWAVRALLADPSTEHQLRALMRHVRLVAGRPERQRGHGAGALVRQITLFLRSLDASAVRPSHAVAGELAALLTQLETPALARDIERSIHDAIAQLWPPPAQPRQGPHTAPDTQPSPRAIAPANDDDRFGRGGVRL